MQTILATPTPSQVAALTRRALAAKRLLARAGLSGPSGAGLIDDLLDTIEALADQAGASQ